MNVTQNRARAALALGLGIGGCALGGCTVSNDGNVMTPPPPALLGTDLKLAAGGSPSVLPSANPTAGGVGVGGPNDVSRPWLSSGCGKPLPPAQVGTIAGTRTGYTEWHVNQTGATLGKDNPRRAGERQFFVRVPADYDMDRPYRVVYVGQGCGAYHGGRLNTEALFSETRGGTEQAVYVGLSVADNDANPGCYDNNSGIDSQEWEAFDLIHTFVEQTYCVDNNRIFVEGYSTGGWLANMWGCYFGGTPSPPLDNADLAAGRAVRKFAPKWAIRGAARMTGSFPANQPLPCNGPAAGIWIHDTLDRSNELETNVVALNTSLQANGCTGSYADGPKRPWAPAEHIPGLEGLCQEYTGCPAEVAKNYPLVFCTTSSFGHADQASVVPAFTTFFDALNAVP